MSAYISHDFKTPRPDGSRRLPRTFMLVPILFYLSLVAGSYLSISSYMTYREASKNRDERKAQTAEQDGLTSKIEQETNTVNKEKLKAEKLVQWVEGTRMIQPITVAITRSIPSEVSLGEMSFERSVDIPAQINLSVRINSGGMEDIGRIQTAVEGLKYHAYNSQQAKSGDFLDYRTILVWQQN
jgi:hypothetical protein